MPRNWCARQEPSPARLEVECAPLRQSLAPALRRRDARGAARHPCPAFSSALSYFDGYRSARLPANLLQAQRDYFGAHTYERVDAPRGKFFHVDWPDLKRPQRPV